MGRTTLPDTLKPIPKQSGRKSSYKSEFCVAEKLDRDDRVSRLIHAGTERAPRNGGYRARYIVLEDIQLDVRFALPAAGFYVDDFRVDGGTWRQEGAEFGYCFFPVHMSLRSCYSMETNI
jgi:hypothetical protein